jgi:hypothetical protein
VTLATVQPTATGSRRIRIEDQEMAETIDIDTARNEIRAFGLTFRATRDGAGAPTLQLSVNGESLDLSNDSDPASMTRHQRAAIARANKFYASTNVYSRAQSVRQILQRTLTEARLHTGVRAQFDLANCIWDMLTVVVDWVGVVLACGPAIIVPFICFGTIAWATYDTVMACRAMATDCTGS